MNARWVENIKKRLAELESTENKPDLRIVLTKSTKISGQFVFMVSLRENGDDYKWESFDKEEDANSYLERTLQDEIICSEIIKEVDILEIRKKGINHD